MESPLMASLGDELEVEIGFAAMTVGTQGFEVIVHVLPSQPQTHDMIDLKPFAHLALWIGADTVLTG